MMLATSSSTRQTHVLETCIDGEEEEEKELVDDHTTWRALVARPYRRRELAALVAEKV
jgi:hypothetical protein